MQDREVVAAVVGGDPAGLAGAFDAYAAGLLGYCRSQLADQADAADAVQDTFIVAAARLSTLADTGRLRDWLQAVADSECQRRLRAGARPATAAATTDPAVGTTQDGNEVAGLLPVLREQVLRLVSSSAPEETRYRDLVVSRAGRFAGSGFPAPSGRAGASQGRAGLVRAGQTAAGQTGAGQTAARQTGARQTGAGQTRRSSQPAALALAVVVVLLALAAGAAVYFVRHHSPTASRHAAAAGPGAAGPGAAGQPGAPSLGGAAAGTSPTASGKPAGAKSKSTSSPDASPGSKGAAKSATSPPGPSGGGGGGSTGPPSTSAPPAQPALVLPPPVHLTIVGQKTDDYFVLSGSFTLQAVNGSVDYTLTGSSDPVSYTILSISPSSGTVDPSDPVTISVLVHEYMDAPPATPYITANPGGGMISLGG